MQFQGEFGFMDFNTKMLAEHASGNLIIAIGPSYLGKSGKATPGLGYFWSGQAGQAKGGLEILGIAAIDIDNHTGFHLQACQTFVRQDSSLADNYTASTIAHKEALRAISKTVVADAWFTKKGFVDAI